MDYRGILLPNRPPELAREIETVRDGGVKNEMVVDVFEFCRRCMNPK
jgi:hypothetical protein